ncbi:MAG: HEAT repeat domain-containing protein [Anaerolineales bacterium]
MDDSFDRVLESLATLDLPADQARLFELSDLDQSQVESFQRAWLPIAEPQRRRVMQSLGELARDHIELNFDRIHCLALDDAAGEVRRSAIENLWESEDPALVPKLLHALGGDPQPDVRAAAAAALGPFVYLGEVGRIEPMQLREMEDALLLAAEGDADPAVRLRALESIGFSSRDEVSPLVERAFHSGQEGAQRAALLAMGRSANESWGPDVMSQLYSPAPALRLEAVRAAGELELRDSVPAVIELLDDVDEDVHRAAIWSLGQLGGTRARDALQRLAPQAEGQDEIAMLEDALDNLAFVDGTRDLDLLDLEDEAE